MRLRSAPARVLVAIVAGAIGFLLMSQLSSRSGLKQQLEAESQEDLTRIFSRLNEESAALHDEVTQLEVQLQALSTSAQRNEVAQQSASRQVQDLEILSGTVGAHGPGILIKVTDPTQVFTLDLFIDLIQELRDAGAEALSVNDRRVGMATYFGETKSGALTVDGAAVTSPIRVVAIGDPATLDGGLRIPGGAADEISALDRVELSVVRQNDVTVPALARVPVFKTAHPVE
jgi:uncharacterized protein YlxW (UPF0749 family)